MATKEDKRQVRGVIEGLEYRLHSGPPIRDTEIQSVRIFLHQRDFSPTSDYYQRLVQVENRLQTRPREPGFPSAKRNYGGEAAGYQMQVQSVFDHLILSTCYAGEFNLRRGRIKISHRFNQEGRIDFVESKFLCALQPRLNGALRKLLMVKDYQSLRKDWFEAEAFVLKVLPQELIFLCEDIFRCPRTEFLAWLLNIGHGLVQDLVRDLKSRPVTCRTQAGAARSLGAFASKPPVSAPAVETQSPDWLSDNADAGEVSSTPRRGPSEQLSLPALLQDETARPILEKAAGLESVVEIIDPTTVLVRYLRTRPS